MKLFKGLLIAALLVAFAIPGYAETQSIKLSGDIIIRHIVRDDYDFNSHDSDTDATDGTYFMTNAEVQLDADLTDNVSATIRVINQRDWTAPVVDGSCNTTNEYDMAVDLAYVTLKEFFFQPLTIRIGRQDIWLGKGFIVGANYQDPNATISADEWTSVVSFDAIRATWDFEPWTLDTVFAEIDENHVRADDDIQLYGANLGYILDFYNAETEVYYWFKKDDGIMALRSGSDTGDRIHCLGMRGSFEPHDDITLWGEYAIQRGTYIKDATPGEKRNREAFAVDLGSEIRLWKEQYAWEPVVGAEYIFYSGQAEHKNRSGSDYHAWDRMYRGKVDSAIHEWYNVFYTTGMPTTSDNGGTNLHQFILCGSITPMDNLSVDARWISFRLAEEADTGNKNVGNELDVELIYEYTEDVTFGLLSAWFWSGDYYTTPEHAPQNPIAGGTETVAKGKSVASEVVATCRVTF
ncbi:MAG: alginate export family protein [Candidatus Omnitrophota bacterium]|nr:alginate export family protein [Candidatus Omnitrophota bacterium]